MMTTIRSNSRMSNAGLHRSGGLGSPASRWSLRSEAGEYVSIGSHRGDATLDIEIDLEPGRYVLSCGRGGDRIEQEILVGDAATERAETAAEIIDSLPRLSGSPMKTTLISPAVAAKRLADLWRETNAAMDYPGAVLTHGVASIYPAGANGCGGILRVDSWTTAERVAREIRAIRSETKTVVKAPLVVVGELCGSEGWIECHSDAPWVRMAWSPTQVTLEQVSSRDIAERIVQSPTQVRRHYDKWIQ